MGEKIKIEEILTWTKSKLISGRPGQYIDSVSTDSRTIKEGEFFLPLIGENYNGHDFIYSALKKGASGFVYESIYTNKLKFWKSSIKSAILDKLIVFQSENNLEFLEKVSYGYIRKFNPIVIGITGSVGKTTTKDLIVNVLSKLYDTKYTPKNFNTEIGVSKTILEIDRNTDIFVAEFGMRGKGQIKLLSDMCDVDIGIITAVGKSHLEFFKDPREVATAKMEIGKILESKNGVLFLNRDDDWSNFIKKHVNCRIIEFGRDNGIDYNFIEKDVDNLGRFVFDMYCKRKKVIEIYLSIPGYHNIYNACSAAAVCLYLNVEAKFIKEGIEKTHVEAGRMELIKKGDMIIINDCYNANPLSVRKAIDTLSLVSIKNGSRSVAILGDMLELGEESSELHYEVGEYLAKKGIDVLVALGKLSRHIYQGYNDCISSDNFSKSKCLCFYFKSKEQLSSKLKSILKQGDLVLVKGSRANRMESIIDLI